MVTLYHYTCEHAHAAIGPEGTIYPATALAPRRLSRAERQRWQDRLPPWSRLVWLTDMTPPMREALGLTMDLLRCDRTRFRYRVTDLTDVVPWTIFRHALPTDARKVLQQLEYADGARPVHWYVSASPVPVTLDPIRQGAPV